VCCCQSSYVSHTTSILLSCHRLKVTERTEYKLLSLTCSHNHPTFVPALLVSVQPHRSTRSSSLVTLARPPTSSSLRVTDRSFRYASPCLWNQLPASLRKPHPSLSNSDSALPTPVTSSCYVDSPLSSTTPSLFLSRLKPTYFTHPSFLPTVDCLPHSDRWLHVLFTRVVSSVLYRFLFFVYFSLFFCLWFTAVD